VGETVEKMRLTGDSRTATQALRQTTDAQEKFEGATKRSAGEMAIAANQALELGQKLLGAAKQAYAFVDATTAEVDAIAKTSRALGATSDEYQRLSFASQRSGASQASLDKGLRALTVGLNDAQTKGTGPFVEGLQALGLQYDDLAGKKVEQQFGLLADALQGVDNEQKKAAVSAKLFGARAGVELGNVLRIGSRGVSDLGNELRDMGAIIDADTVARAEEAQDAILGMELQSRVLKAELANELIPTMIRFGEVARDVATISDNTTSFIDELGDLATRTFDDMGLSAENAGKTTSAFGQIWDETMTLMSVKSLTGLGPALDAFDNLEEAANDTEEALGRVTERGVPMARSMVTAAQAANALTATLHQLAGQAAADNANAALAAGAMLHAIENVERKAISARREVDQFLQQRQEFARALEAQQMDRNFAALDRGTFEDTREFERQAEQARQAENFERLGELRDEARLDRERQAEDEREKRHQALLDRDRAAEESAQRRAKKEAFAMQSSLALSQHVLGLGSAIADAAIKDDEKRAKFKARAAGVEAMIIGTIESVKAVAAFASFNYVQGALHTAAAATAFVQGGLLLSGTIPGGGSVSAGGGGGAAANVPTGVGGADNGPPGGGGEMSESAIPPSAQTVERPTANERPNQGGAGGGARGERSIHIGAINAYGSIDGAAAVQMGYAVQDAIDRGEFEFRDE
jgi:hypothetical protein